MQAVLRIKPSFVVRGGHVQITNYFAVAPRSTPPSSGRAAGGSGRDPPRRDAHGATPVGATDHWQVAGSSGRHVGTGSGGGRAGGGRTGGGVGRGGGGDDAVDSDDELAAAVDASVESAKQQMWWSPSEEQRNGLRARGFKLVVEVRGDGNCFWRSLQVFIDADWKVIKTTVLTFLQLCVNGQHGREASAFFRAMIAGVVIEDQGCKVDPGDAAGILRYIARNGIFAPTAAMMAAQVLFGKIDGLVQTDRFGPVQYSYNFQPIDGVVPVAAFICRPWCAGVDHCEPIQRIGSPAIVKQPLHASVSGTKFDIKSRASLWWADFLGEGPDVELTWMGQAAAKIQSVRDEVLKASKGIAPSWLTALPKSLPTPPALPAGAAFRMPSVTPPAPVLSPVAACLTAPPTAAQPTLAPAGALLPSPTAQALPALPFASPHTLAAPPARPAPQPPPPVPQPPPSDESDDELGGGDGDDGMPDVAEPSAAESFIEISDEGSSNFDGNPVGGGRRSTQLIRQNAALKRRSRAGSFVKARVDGELKERRPQYSEAARTTIITAWQQHASVNATWGYLQNNVKGFENISRTTVTNVINNFRTPKLKAGVAGRPPTPPDFENLVMSKVMNRVVSDVGEGKTKKTTLASIVYSYEILRKAVDLAKKEYVGDHTKLPKSVSNDYIRSLLRRQKLHRVRCTAEHKIRPTVEECDAIMKAMQDEIVEGSYSSDEIVSADETGLNWQLSPLYKFVERYVRADKLPGDDYLRLTGLFSILACGKILPGFFIIKNSSKNVGDLSRTTVIKELHSVAGFRERDGWEYGIFEDTLPLGVEDKAAQLRADITFKVPYIRHKETLTVITTQKKAWIDSVRMIMWLELQLVPYVEKSGKRLYIVVDNCGAHKVPCVKAAFDALGDKVRIRFLPKNMTDRLQVCDVILNGPLKRRMRAARAADLFDAFQDYLTAWQADNSVAWRPVPPDVAKGLDTVMNVLLALETSLATPIKRCFVKVGLLQHDSGGFTRYTSHDCGISFATVGMTGAEDSLDLADLINGPEDEEDGGLTAADKDYGLYTVDGELHADV